MIVKFESDTFSGFSTVTISEVSESTGLELTKKVLNPEVTPEQVFKAYDLIKLAEVLRDVNKVWNRGNYTLLGKIACIKLVRTLTSMGLKEAKDFVEQSIEHYTY